MKINRARHWLTESKIYTVLFTGLLAIWIIITYKLNMKTHTKVYLNHFKLEQGDYIGSEITGAPAQDIHHINARGMGGSKDKDYIENLMALTRKEHDIVEMNPQLDWYFYFIHLHYLQTGVAWCQNPLSKNDYILKEILEGGNIRIDRSIN